MGTDRQDLLLTCSMQVKIMFWFWSEVVSLFIKGSCSPFLCSSLMLAFCTRLRLVHPTIPELQSAHTHTPLYLSDACMHSYISHKMQLASKACLCLPVSHILILGLKIILRAQNGMQILIDRIQGQAEQSNNSRNKFHQGLGMSKPFAGAWCLNLVWWSFFLVISQSMPCHALGIFWETGRLL